MKIKQIAGLVKNWLKPKQQTMKKEKFSLHNEGISLFLQDYSLDYPQNDKRNYTTPNAKYLEDLGYFKEEIILRKTIPVAVGELFFVTVEDFAYFAGGSHKFIVTYTYRVCLRDSLTVSCLREKVEKSFVD